MTTTAVLDLTLDTDANGYRLRMHFVPPDGSAARDVEAPVTFDFAALRALELDAGAYGKTLYHHLLADRNAEIFFRECRAAAGSAPLRLRVCLRAEAQDLHGLRWETLRDTRGESLTTGDRVWFSRYLFSDQARPATLRPRADLRAVVAIANPSGSHLAAVNVAVERERATSTLGGMVHTVLDGKTGERATLENLLRHARECDVLYLACHGTFNKDEAESALWLEDVAGAAQRVTGQALIDRLREFQLPRLVVLLACQSAHSDETRALLSLGPRLSALGVPAVVAMQGDISMDTGARFMAEFFRALAKDGQIDQAFAVARSVIQARLDAWMPTLFLRSESGRLWEEPTPVNETVQGPETHIAGNVTGPVLSGNFQGPVNVGNITVGNISGSTGIAIGHGAQVTVNQHTGLASDDMARLFALLTQKVNALPEGTTKEDAQDAVKKLETEAKKADQADEGRARRLMEFLVEVLPEAWEVTVNTILNPLAGLNTVFKKIADRVKAEREKKSTP